MTAMFGEPPKPSPAAPPPTMPDPMSPEVRAAKMRTIADGSARSGRQSTVYTTRANRTLAGGETGAKALG